MSKKDDYKTEIKKTRRGLFWASIGFYGLVAFEFFYMFSPFAVYFYGVYGPGLEILNLSNSTSWVIRFFMPHIVRETQSFWINRHEIIGGLLFFGGLAGFAIGAGQIYWNKLTRKAEAVSGGIYQRIRHPQYLALMISSFGMVLLWPRYLVLFGFVTVCFAYFFLARTEEKVCREKFSEYSEYFSKTGMFLPLKIERLFYNIPRPGKRIWKIAAVIGCYIVFLLASFGTAYIIHQQSVNSLYTYSDSNQNEVYVSLGELGLNKIATLVKTAQSNTNVKERLSGYRGEDYRMINYVMPTDLLVSEVPMFIPEGRGPSHQNPSKLDQNRYKIIYTLADFGSQEPAKGRDILLHAVNKSPVLEVWINREMGKIEKIIEPTGDQYYGGMPVPVF